MHKGMTLCFFLLISEPHPRAGCTAASVVGACGKEDPTFWRGVMEKGLQRPISGRLSSDLLVIFCDEGIGSVLVTGWGWILTGLQSHSRVPFPKILT